MVLLAVSLLIAGSSGIVTAVAVVLWGFAFGAVGGGLLVDHLGALGAPGFAAATLTLGTLLTLRHGPRPERAVQDGGPAR